MGFGTKSVPRLHVVAPCLPCSKPPITQLVIYYPK